MLDYYRKLLGMTIHHTFYSKGESADFSFAPTRDTQQQLREYGLVFRAAETGFRLFYRARDNAGNIVPVRPLTGLESGDSLRFEMRLNNPAFLNFTDMGPGFTTLKKSVLLFRSTGGTLDKPGSIPEGLAMPGFRIVAIRPQEFPYRFEVTGNPPSVTLLVKNSRGEVLRSLIVNRAPDNTYSVLVNLTSARPGEYIFTKMLPSGALIGSEERYYLDDNLVGNPPFAVVELVNDGDGDGPFWEQIQSHNETPANNAQMEYSISFAHKVDAWKYTVIFKHTSYLNDPTKYAIRDAFTTVISGDRYNTGNPPDKFFFSEPPVAETFEGKPALVFTSVDNLNNPQTFPWYEEAKQDLVLAEINPGGVITKKLVRMLPNPTTGYPKTEIIVFI